SREDQERCLAAQLDLAKSLRAPVVFHCREAYPDLLDRLAGWVGGSLLFHCFAGNVHELGRASLLDAYFGVDGPITYKNSDSLRAVVQKMPLDRIVLETDAPWMAPVPYRGQNNKPAWLPLINKALADALGQSESAMAETSTANAARFFQWGD
ncbi:MAG: TatD family hydrolase, partial [Chthonomonadaceae bacterium]|nr:TatD family hydrolase [Chthonomonadaceae bacterium]